MLSYSIYQIAYTLIMFYVFVIIWNQMLQPRFERKTALILEIAAGLLYLVVCTSLGSLLPRSSIIRTIGELQAEWEGSASESYATRYGELKPGFQKAEELIREIATALDSTAKILEETDTSIGNQFKG